jgi:hypothetical protein
MQEYVRFCFERDVKRVQRRVRFQPDDLDKVNCNLDLCSASFEKACQDDLFELSFTLNS